MEGETLSVSNSYQALLLDSSVIIKWFRKGEEFHAHALKVRQRYLDGHLLLAALDLSFYEIANVLRYKPDLNASDVEQAVKSLWDMGLRLVPVTSTILATAIQMAYKFDLTVYDAAFLAATDEAEVPLVTADRKLYDRAEALGNIIFLSEF